MRLAESVNTSDAIGTRLLLLLERPTPFVELFILVNDVVRIVLERPTEVPFHPLAIQLLSNLLSDTKLPS